MIERYTSDVPAIPDPDFVRQNPKQEDWYKELEENSELIPENLRASFERMFEAKRATEPKTYDYFVEKYFDWSSAPAFIGQYVVYNEAGRLDLDRTSEKINIPYSYDMQTPVAHGEIVGLPGDSKNSKLEIHLNPERDSPTVTFGHEIGHFFWQVMMRQGDSGYNRLEEQFCDYFGRFMAMPAEKLHEYEQIDEPAVLAIMSRFGANLNDTMIHLMEIGLLPERVAVDSFREKITNPDFSEKVTRGFYCLHCERVGGDYQCPNAGTNTLLFDFTDRAWGDNLSVCLGEKLDQPEIMSTLTKYYMTREVQLDLFNPNETSINNS